MYILIALLVYANGQTATVVSEHTSQTACLTAKAAVTQMAPYGGTTAVCVAK